MVWPTPLWTLFDKGSSCFPLKIKSKYHQLVFKQVSKFKVKRCEQILHLKKKHLIK